MVVAIHRFLDRFDIAIVIERQGRDGA